MDIQIVFFGIFVVIVIIAAAISAAVAKRARKAAQQWAAAHRWSWSPADPTLVSRWSSPPFRRGRNRSARNVLTGTWNGRPATSFQYSYTTGSGKHRTTHFYHVIAYSLPAHLPWLQLEPEGVGDSIAKFFGGQDIELESARFNQAWRVKGPEGPFPYDFLHPRMMQRLLGPDVSGASITVEGTDLYLYRSGKQELAAIQPSLQLLSDLMDQIPRFLWLKVGYDPEATGAAR